MNILKNTFKKNKIRFHHKKKEQNYNFISVIIIEKEVATCL